MDNNNNSLDLTQQYALANAEKPSLLKESFKTLSSKKTTKKVFDKVYLVDLKKPSNKSSEYISNLASQGKSTLDLLKYFRIPASPNKTPVNEKTQSALALSQSDILAQMRRGVSFFSNTKSRFPTSTRQIFQAPVITQRPTSAVATAQVVNAGVNSVPSTSVQRSFRGRFAGSPTQTTTASTMTTSAMTRIQMTGIFSRRRNNIFAPLTTKTITTTTTTEATTPTTTSTTTTEATTVTTTSTTTATTTTTEATTATTTSTTTSTTTTSTTITIPPSLATFIETTTASTTST